MNSVPQFSIGSGLVAIESQYILYKNILYCCIILMLQKVNNFNVESAMPQVSNIFFFLHPLKQTYECMLV